MHLLFTIYPEHMPLTFRAVLWVTIALLCCTIFFFFYTYLKRAQKLRKEQLKQTYQSEIDAIFFAYLFGMESLETCVARLRKTGWSDHPVFQKVALKALISLHRSYGNDQKESLRSLYIQSGLSAYSMRKIASGKWVRMAEGIRDLSNFHVHDAENVIASQLYHKHEVVRNEALLGMVKLQGLDFLTSPDIHAFPLNDWMQSNILHVVKANKLQPPNDLKEVLYSTDATWQLLALRLIDHFRLVQYIPHFEKMNTRNQRVRVQLQQVKERLSTFLNG